MVEFLAPLPTASELAFGLGAGSVLLLALANYLFNHVLRPLPRLCYTLVVVYVCGTLMPAVALRALVATGVLPSTAFAFDPIVIAGAAVLGLGLLAAAIRSEPSDERRRVPVLLVALLAPSLAEALVFLGVVQTAAAHVLHALLPEWGAAAGAVVVSALLFALYHLTHAPPWNRWPLPGRLFLVWLLVGGLYAVTGNLGAAAAVNTTMAAIGFVKGRVTRAEAQPPLVSLGLDAVAVLTVWLVVVRV